MSEIKTNVMRILEKKKVAFSAHSYPHGDEAVDGATVAELTGQNPDQVFKTLITQGASKQYYVFVIPVLCELDLKKAAKAVGEKSVVMLHVADLLPLTGYVRGGCSPIGMKKLFPTVVDAAAQKVATIMVSAGKIGYQVELAPNDLLPLCRGKYAEVTK